MNYRDFPRGDRKASALGMGCMRLPVLPNSAKTDKDKAVRLIRYLIDRGVNYVDTAFAYGQSEEVVGEALKDGYREKVILATKLPTWMVQKYDDMEAFLDIELKRLGVDCVDVYLAHALREKRFNALVKLGLFRFMDAMIAKGKIRCPGFSFHDDAEMFRTIVDSYDWGIAQVQMNILDEFNQATMQGVRYAASKGIGVVVMEPLRGGTLIRNVPERIRDLYEGAAPGRSVAEWCFRWLIDKPELMTVLSGMNEFSQAEENLRIFSSCEAGCLSERERAVLLQVRRTYEQSIRVGCTGCGYCMPCPRGIKIPSILREYDSASIFGDYSQFKKYYNAQEVNASACVRCGKCVSACPQHYETPIPVWLGKIHDEFGDGE